MEVHGWYVESWEHWSSGVRRRNKEGGSIVQVEKQVSK